MCILLVCYINLKKEELAGGQVIQVVQKVCEVVPIGPGCQFHTLFRTFNLRHLDPTYFVLQLNYPVEGQHYASDTSALP